MGINLLHHFKFAVVTKFAVTGLCCAFMAGVSLETYAANNKDRYEPRYSVMSRKAAEALLTDVQVVGDKIVAVGERGHILVSQDQGQSWKQAKVPTIELLTAVYFPNEQYGWALGHEGLILHTKDGGSNWEVQYADPYFEPGPDDEIDYDAGPSRAGQPLLDLWFRNEKEGYVVGAYGAFLYTRDGGLTWEDWSERVDNIDGWHLNTIGTFDGETIYIAGEMGTLFRSVDSGETWERLNSPYEGSFFGMLAGPDPDGAIIFGLQGHIYKTEDKGETWREIFTTNTNGLMSAVALSPSGIIVVGNGGVIMYSKNGGDSFTKQITEDRQSIVGIAKTSANKLVLVGNAGVSIASPNSSVLGTK
ncbi:MAG: YCF48-related protein [Pseudomonadales bacterium]|nr:YCF48-related protein [Pseudomonadales bacterium]